jgi:hypothetical protein
MEKPPKHRESWDRWSSLHFPPDGLLIHKVTE